MSHWMEDDGLHPVYADAFGGRIYDVPFDAVERDDLGDDLPADEDVEEDARELREATEANGAHLIVHANGHEEWTRSGLDFAKDILHNRYSQKSRAQMDLFDIAA